MCQYEFIIDMRLEFNVCKFISKPKPYVRFAECKRDNEDGPVRTNENVGV